MKKLIVVLMLVGMVSLCAMAQDSADAYLEEDGDGVIEPGENETEELQRAVQNPVAELISLPFQNNITFETGPKGRTQNILNIQPVIPFNLNEDWNLITRTIVPIINQPPLTDAQSRQRGVGNTQFSAFLSPTKSGKWLWGAGPNFEFPTNSDDMLGSDNWSAGPSLVVLTMEGPWVYGGLINQLWSYSGSDPEVNKMLIQPFINYNMEDGWYLSSSPIITANWKADSSNQWTIPVGGGIGKIIRIGKLPVNVSTQVFYNVESPNSGGDWSARFQLQLLFPK
ncbi:MAG: neuromedin U [Planctomycetota bacterium]|jgi:hypothetical protein